MDFCFRLPVKAALAIKHRGFYEAFCTAFFATYKALFIPLSPCVDKMLP